MTYTETRHISGSDHFCIRPLRPARLLRRFRRYFERSDWDLKIIRLEPLFDAVCLVAVILSGLVLSPIIIAVFLK